MKLGASLESRRKSESVSMKTVRSETVGTARRRGLLALDLLISTDFKRFKEMSLDWYPSCPEQERVNHLSL
jgi:hypothetical protein